MTTEQSKLGSTSEHAAPVSKENAKRVVERMEQCVYRNTHSCALIDLDLGFGSGLDWDTCDRCWNAGGIDGGDEHRDRFVRDKVAYWKRPENIKRANRQILVPLTVKHMDPAERKKLLPEDSRFSLRADLEWTKVKPSWQKAHSFLRSILSKGFTGKVATDEQFKQRHVSCFGTTPEGIYVQSPCPSLAKSKDQGRHYCNACGCGDRSIAHLDSKLMRFPHLECPRKRPGFSNHEVQPSQESD